MTTPALPPAGASPAALPELDHALHAMAARMTHGLSPASLALAYLDWLSHLLAAPGRQPALAAAAHRQLCAQLQAAGQVRADPLPVATAAAPDHRFDAPTRRQRPSQPMVRGFHLCEHWWDAATTGLPGVSPHHQQLVNFGARQWLDLLAPSNFFWTNPEERARACGPQQQGSWWSAWDHWLSQRSGWRPPSPQQAFERRREMRREGT